MRLFKGGSQGLDLDKIELPVASLRAPRGRETEAALSKLPKVSGAGTGLGFAGFAGVVVGTPVVSVGVGRASAGIGIGASVVGAVPVWSVVAGWSPAAGWSVVAGAGVVWSVVAEAGVVVVSLLGAFGVVAG